MTAAAAMLALALAMPSKYAGTQATDIAIVSKVSSSSGTATTSFGVSNVAIPPGGIALVWAIGDGTMQSGNGNSVSGSVSGTYTNRAYVADYVSLWTAYNPGPSTRTETVTVSGPSTIFVLLIAVVVGADPNYLSNVVTQTPGAMALPWSATITLNRPRSMALLGMYTPSGTRSSTPAVGVIEELDTSNSGMGSTELARNAILGTGATTISGTWNSTALEELAVIELAALSPVMNKEARPILDYGPVTADSNWATTGAASSVTTSGPNRLVLVFVSSDGNTAAAPGVTGSTLGAFTLLYTAASAGDFEWTWVYGKFATSAVTGETLTVGSFGASNVQSRTTVLAYANARNLTTLVAGTDYAAGTPSPMSTTANALVTLTTKAGGSVLVMSGVSQNGTGPFTTTGQTQVVAWGNNSAGGGSPSRYFGTFTSGAYLPTSTYTIGIVTSQSSGAQVYAAIEVPPQ